MAHYRPNSQEERTLNQELKKMGGSWRERAFQMRVMRYSEASKQ